MRSILWMKITSFVCASVSFAVIETNYLMSKILRRHILIWLRISEVSVQGQLALRMQHHSERTWDSKASQFMVGGSRGGEQRQRESGQGSHIAPTATPPLAIETHTKVWFTNTIGGARANQVDELHYNSLLSHLIFTKIPWQEYYYPQFIKERLNKETRRCHIIRNRKSRPGNK